MSFFFKIAYYLTFIFFIFGVKKKGKKKKGKGRDVKETEK